MKEADKTITVYSKQLEEDYPEMKAVHADTLNGNSWLDWLDAVLVIGAIGFAAFSLWIGIFG